MRMVERKTKEEKEGANFSDLPMLDSVKERATQKTVIKGNCSKKAPWKK